MIAGLILTMSLVPSGVGDFALPAPPSLPPVSKPGASPMPAPSSARGTPFQVVGNPGEWVTPEDYPSDALREFKEGTTNFRLQFDTSGKVTSCVITGSAGTPSLDAKACEVLTLRARFSPARDKKGRALPGSYSSRVRWMIPGDKSSPLLTSSEKTIEFDLTSQGHVVNCRAHDTTRNRDIDGACAMFAGKTMPSTGGKPVHVTMRNSTQVDILDKEPAESAPPSGTSTGPN